MIVSDYDVAKAAIDAMYIAHLIGKVGPKGYIHGWIKVGAGQSDEAGMDGKKVDGMTPVGGMASGTYDHKSGTVTDEAGHKASVTHIPAGQADYSHLPPDLQAGIRQYDERVSSGVISFPQDSHVPVGPGIPVASRSGEVGGALGQFLTTRLPAQRSAYADLMKSTMSSSYEIAKAMIDDGYAARLAGII